MLNPDGRECKVIQDYKSREYKEESLRDETRQLSKCLIRMEFLSHSKKLEAHSEARKTS